MAVLASGDEGGSDGTPSVTHTENVTSPAPLANAAYDRDTSSSQEHVYMSPVSRGEESLSEHLDSGFGHEGTEVPEKLYTSLRYPKSHVVREEQPLDSAEGLLCTAGAQKAADLSTPSLFPPADRAQE